MFALEYSGQFKKDLKRMARRGADISLITAVIRQLEQDGQVKAEHRPHVLSGKWAGFWECHITPDWLLIYDVASTVRLVRLVRTGSHSELLKNKRR